MIICLTALPLERAGVIYKRHSSLLPESLQMCCCSYACQMSSGTFWSNRDVGGLPIDGASVTLPYTTQLLCVSFSGYIKGVINIMIASLYDLEKELTLTALS
jgi:hypothetical protein